MPEAFAVAREAAKRATGMRPFDVQVMGAVVLHQGSIAEMKTGEGKTLVATLPVYLNALAGRGVHVVTVNDYLAGRDAVWMGPVYEFLGLKVAALQNSMEAAERRDAYLADITYGTNTEFGFDYLRDNMVLRTEQQVQRGHFFCIVDEVDSILIDEARTPLIISGPGERAAKTYYDFARIARRLRAGEGEEGDYEVDEKKRTVAVTEDGLARVEKELGIDNIYEDLSGQLVNHLMQALRATALFKRDVDYLVTDGEVKIIDEFTGRILEGRRYSEGLHQAIEAKEGVKIKEENQTLATITLQNYFRLYEKIAGMTGTAATEADEFREIYKMEVVVIPTNQPMIRDDRNDLIYKTEKAKFVAAAELIADCHKRGQPVLVGTISVEKSERLAEMLKRRGVPHEVLNARYHAKEADDHRQRGPAGRRDHRHQHGRPRYRHQAGRRASWKSEGSSSSAPSATRPGGSTTSCAAVPDARATPGSASSSSPWTTICCASSAATASTVSWTGWDSTSRSPSSTTSSPARSRARRRRWKSRTSRSASVCSNTTTS